MNLSKVNFSKGLTTMKKIRRIKRKKTEAEQIEALLKKISEVHPWFNGSNR
jgi:hypothetical protein